MRQLYSAMLGCAEQAFAMPCYAVLRCAVLCCLCAELALAQYTQTGHTLMLCGIMMICAYTTCSQQKTGLI